MMDGWRGGRWCEPHMPHFGCAGDGHVMKPGRLRSAPSDVSPTVAAANQAATTSHRRNPITTQMPLFQTFLMSLTWYYSSADILRLTIKRNPTSFLHHVHRSLHAPHHADHGHDGEQMPV